MSTKDRILDAAEKLFAQNGFADTSLREITAEAGANLAAVNYHFQSKDALIQAVFSRRLQPINRERLAHLDAMEAEAGGPVPLESVLRALLEPVLALGGPHAAPYVGQLFGRLYAEPRGLFARIFREEMGEARKRFIPALQRAVPEVPLQELLWRVHFTFGAVAHTVAGLNHLAVISEGRCQPGDPQTTDRLIAFVAAGLRAPVPAFTEGEQRCEVKS